MVRGKAVVSRIDLHVAERLRIRRISLQYTQADVVKALGVSREMVEKYENGECHIGASVLYEMAQYLQVPITYVFEGLESNDLPQAAVTTMPEFDDPFSDDHIFGIIRNFYRIKDPRSRDTITELLKSLADDQVFDYACA